MNMFCYNKKIFSLFLSLIILINAVSFITLNDMEETDISMVSVETLSQYCNMAVDLPVIMVTKILNNESNATSVKNYTEQPLKNNGKQNNKKQQENKKFYQAVAFDAGINLVQNIKDTADSKLISEQYLDSEKTNGINFIVILIFIFVFAFKGITVFARDDIGESIKKSNIIKKIRFA